MVPERSGRSNAQQNSIRRARQQAVLSQDAAILLAGCGWPRSTRSGRFLTLGNDRPTGTSRKGDPFLLFFLSRAGGSNSTPQCSLSVARDARTCCASDRPTGVETSKPSPWGRSATGPQREIRSPKPGSNRRCPALETGGKSHKQRGLHSPGDRGRQRAKSSRTHNVSGRAERQQPSPDSGSIEPALADRKSAPTRRPRRCLKSFEEAARMSARGVGGSTSAPSTVFSTREVRRKTTAEAERDRSA